MNRAMKQRQIVYSQIYYTTKHYFLIQAYVKNILCDESIFKIMANP